MGIAAVALAVAVPRPSQAAGDCYAKNLMAPGVPLAPGASYATSWIGVCDAGARLPLEKSVGFYLSRDQTITTSDTSLGIFSLILPPYERGRFQSLTIPSDISPGRYWLGVIVDPFNAIAETNESNNTAVSPWFLIGPDLEANASSIVPGIVNQGSSIVVENAVHNHGSAAPASTTRIYLSPDKIITPADTALASRDIPALAYGGINSAATTVSLPRTVSGQFWIAVVADDTGNVVEALETNNISFVPLTITPDTTPPVIAVTGVADGQVSSAAQLVGCVSVSDPGLGPVTATLDGAPLVNGCGTATLEGEHVLSVHAEDLAGNVADAVVHFALDRTPPVPSFVSPVEGQLVNASPLPVRVSVADAHAISTVQVNGIAAALQGDGTWLASVDVVEGSNLLQVAATDVAGNGGSSSAHVTVDTRPPVLTVTSPAEGASVPLTFPVTGSVADQSVVQVNVAGVEATIAGDGSFSATVTVPLGTQLITISAVDAAGHVATVQRAVVTPVPPPTLVISEPLPGFVTSAQTVAVRGQATAWSLPVSVTVSALSSSTVVAGAGGAFSTTVAVPGGPIEIVVTATDAAQRQASATIAGTSTAGGTQDACACVAGGTCTLTRDHTRYCYDAAGNLTARLILVAGEPCVANPCP